MENHTININRSEFEPRLQSIGVEYSDCASSSNEAEMTPMMNF